MRPWDGCCQSHQEVKVSGRQTGITFQRLGWHERLTRSFVKWIHKHSRCLPIFLSLPMIIKYSFYLIGYTLEKRHWFAPRTQQLEHQVTLKTAGLPGDSKQKMEAEGSSLSTHSRSTAKGYWSHLSATTSAPKWTKQSWTNFSNFLKHSQIKKKNPFKLNWDYIWTPSKSKAELNYDN